MKHQTSEPAPLYHHRNPVLGAILAVSMAAEYVRQKVDEAAAPLDITGTQYNILRVLRRVHPDGLSRTAILQHLIEKSVDVTRSIDGLVESGLVERRRTEEDRRLSIAVITEQGIHALEAVDPHFHAMLHAMEHVLTVEEWQEFIRLCEKFMQPIAATKNHMQDQDSEKIGDKVNEKI
jgi:DNA-binding MarR family transcriptional regulator